MTKKIISALQEKVKGLKYYSEYEYPLTFFNIDVMTEEKIPFFIAAYKNNADEKNVKNISAEHFFARFENYLSYGGPDELLNENARRFTDLHLFLKQNFSKLFVYRIENPGEALIPVFIIAKDGNDGFVGLESIAVET